MTDTIKITSLSQIGTTIPGSTLTPVVDMSGTPTTKKATIANIANAILNNAGNGYAYAAKANLANTAGSAGSVSNASQPNITSVGTLTSLTVSGATNLGPVGNVTITGGTVGQVLTTNGSNVLSWTTVSGGSYGNSDVANYLPTFTGNIGANVVTANLFVGSGANLTNLAGANVSGTVGLATYATTANAVAGANVSGFVPNANVANTAYAVAAANVSGLGNIATINLTGSNANVLYGNGVFAAVAGGANTGNVTFDDNIVIGTGDEYGGDGLFLATGPNGAANLQYLRLRGGDFPTHIHLDTGNNAYYDQYFGNDNKFVKLEAGDTGNVVIGTDDATGNLYNWTFTSDGNFILANGNSVIQSIANSSLDPVNPNVSTMVLTPDPGYSTQSLVLDPTAPGHIHLRAPGANIDEPSANIFLGGETSSFEVGYHNGAAPNLFIHSGNNTWTFDNAGNLTFPRDAAGNTDPILTVISGATPTIQSTDASLAGPANLAIQSNYLNLSGFSGDKIVFYADTGEIATDANMTLTTNLANTGNTYSWTFGDDGRLTFPGTPRIDTDANNFEVQAAESINFEANTVVNIYTDTGNTTYQWQFGDDGVLTVPGNLVAVTASPAPTISGFSSVSALTFTSTVVPYANLPAATTAGQRAFISDANLVAVGNFGNVVGNGGSNTVCVWSDGTNWRIG